MSVKRAVTFGTQYSYGNHPKLGLLAHPDGYIVVEAETYGDVRDLLAIVCGREIVELEVGSDENRRIEKREGAVLFAFDYDLDEFEAPGGTASRFHPRGRLAEFSALPLPAGTVSSTEGEGPDGEDA